MKLSAEIGDVQYRILLDEAVDLSIPVDFSGPQPNLYDVPAATSRPFQGESFLGDTREVGAVNFSTVQITPHCNGTHTECAGHLTHERRSVLDVMPNTLIPCTLASISPVAASDTAETALDDLSPEDLVVTRQEVEKHLRRVPSEFRECLIVRTFPNHRSKKWQQYGDRGAPFFTKAAITALADHGVKHLVTDLPSIDPLNDGGELAAHRLFWGIEPGRFELHDNSHADRTITELVYVPDSVSDGIFLLNIQAAAFTDEATPSRPVLIPLEMI